MSTVVFWGCVAAIVYTYVGYPCVLFAIALIAQAKADIAFLFSRRSRRRESLKYLPSVAVLVSVYNEENVILEKIRNSQELDYPSDHLQILFGLDAPTDGTSELLSQLDSRQYKVFHFPTRRGKLAVLRDLAQRTSAEILVFTDANTMFDRQCIRKLVRHFADPNVGVVSGEEVRMPSRGSQTSAEAATSRYETGLRFLESRVNCLLGAYGAVYAIRHSLFEPNQFSIVEDFKIPAQIRFDGYRVLYDPEAVAIEEIAPELADQFERRVRLSTGSYETLFGNPQFLNPFKGLPAFAYFSHRVMRWLVPWFLLGALICNSMLASRPFYAWIFAAQVVFYGMAAIGFLRSKGVKQSGLFWMPLHFVSGNVACLFGFFRYVGGRQNAAWKVTPRVVPALPGKRGQD